MAESTVIVFERKPRWMPELQRQFPVGDVRIRGAASLSDDVLREETASTTVMVLVLAGAEAQCLRFVGRMSTVGAVPLCRPDTPPMIVVGSRQTAELEWTLRELGAADFVLDSINGDEMAELCRRFVEREG